MGEEKIWGRPLKFKTPEELQNKVDEYFRTCEETKTPLTITGLAYHLETTRETLMDYQKRDNFSDTIKRAKLRIEMDYEKALRARGSAGDIFGLKNFGWKDKFETEGTITGSLEIGIKRTIVGD